MRIAARTWRSLRRTALAAGVLAVAAGLALAASAATGFTFAGVADWDRDGHQDIVAVDSAGALWLYPGQSKRTMSTVDRAQIGRGWTGFTFAGVADWDRDGHQDIVAVDSAGALWLYPGQSKRTMSTVDRAQIGRGWTGFTFAGVADWDRDRHQDIVAKDSAGVLWLYPGESKRTMSTADRVQIGHGW